MPWLVRMNPLAPCPGDTTAHHPHMMVCDDPDDDCWDDLDDGHGYMEFHALRCCIDGENWPCKTKMTHVSQREAKKKANAELHKVSDVARG